MPTKIVFLADLHTSVQYSYGPYGSYGLQYPFLSPQVTNILNQSFLALAFVVYTFSFLPSSPPPPALPPPHPAPPPPQTFRPYSTLVLVVALGNTRKFTHRASKRCCVLFAAVWREPGIIIRCVLFAAGWREPGVVCYHI